MLVVTLMCILVGAPAGRLMHKVSPRVLITGGLLVTRGLAAVADVRRRRYVVRFAGLAAGPAGPRPGLRHHADDGRGRRLRTVPPGRYGGCREQRVPAGRRRAGLAVLGAVLSTKAGHTLPGHLTDVGLPAATIRSVTSVVDANGLGAVAGMNLGADRGRALGALSEAFLDGLHLCLIIAAALTLVAAAVGAVLLRSPAAAGHRAGGRIRRRPGGAAGDRRRSPGLGSAADSGARARLRHGPPDRPGTPFRGRNGRPTRPGTTLVPGLTVMLDH